MNDVLKKAEDRFNETAIDDEVVVMNLDSGDFFSLTGTAGSIWQLIDGSRDRAAVLAALAAEYGVEPDEIAGDLDAFLAQLREAGLLTAG